MNRILLIEDEELMGKAIKLNLEKEGHHVAWARNAGDGLRSLESDSYDLVVLDLLLPDGRGEDILRELRSAGLGVPVLVLTALGDVDTKVTCLDAGADDYITKPFDIRELTARIKALIRRSLKQGEIPSSRIVSIGRYKVNLETREAVTCRGNVVLTEKECALVELFAKNRGIPLTRPDIIEEVWGMDESPTNRTVDNFIMRLRRMFEDDPKRPRHFLTVRSLGYKFEA